MFFRKILIILLISVFTPSVFAGRGGWSGNGGNIGLETLNPWFLGDAPVPYCVFTSARPISKVVAEVTVKKQIQKWKDFFIKYQLSHSEFKYFESKISNIPIAKINLNYELSQDCQEVELKCISSASNSDSCAEALKEKVLILVGLKNQVVEDYLKMNSGVLGAAIRTEYDHQSHRSGGIVWVDQIMLKDFSKFEHLLLHEIGHAFGMKHNSCWVMHEQVATQANIFFKNYLGKIESTFWPYSYSLNDLLTLTDEKTYVENGPNGFLKNTFLPAKAREIFRFQESNYFKVTARLINNSIRTFEFQFEEYPTGEKRILKGNLQEENYDLYKLFVPQLTSFYPDYQTGFLDQDWISSRLSGVLNFENQSIYVRLDRERGLRAIFYFSGAEKELVLDPMGFSVNSIRKGKRK